MLILLKKCIFLNEKKGEVTAYVAENKGFISTSQIKTFHYEAAYALDQNQNHYVTGENQALMKKFRIR